jgi:hypothetical protein
MVDGTLRLTVDIEPRHAQDAFRLFGAPGVPMALAALKTAAQQERKGPEPQRLSTLAALMCKRDDFVQFIRRIYDVEMGGTGRSWGDVSPEDFGGDTERYARHCIMVLCELKESRAELDTNDEAAALFRSIILRPWAEHQRAA